MENDKFREALSAADTKYDGRVTNGSLNEQMKVLLRIIEAGNALARSIGHRMGVNCPKISPAVPCTCGAGAQQLIALAAWDRLMEEWENPLDKNAAKG